MGRGDFPLVLVLATLAGPVAADPCVSSSFDTPLPGAEQVSWNRADVPAALFPGFWQNGWIGGYRYSLYSDGTGTLAADAVAPSWSIEIACGAEARICDYRPSGPVPNAASAVARGLGRCLLGPDTPLKRAGAKPEPTSRLVETDPRDPPKADDKPAAEIDPTLPAMPARTAAAESKIPAPPDPVRTTGKEQPKDTDPRAPAPKTDVPKVSEAEESGQKGATKAGAVGSPSKGGSPPSQPKPGPEQTGAAKEEVSPPAPDLPNARGAHAAPSLARSLPAKSSAPVAPHAFALPAMDTLALPTAAKGKDAQPRSRGVFRLGGGLFLSPLPLRLPKSPEPRAANQNTQPACGLPRPVQEEPVFTLQRLLVAAGRDPGVVDGALGSKTLAALDPFWPEHGNPLDVVEAISRVEAQLCKAGMPRPRPPAPPVATPGVSDCVMTTTISNGAKVIHATVQKVVCPPG